jgi:CheY-like chemotaxis protein
MNQGITHGSGASSVTARVLVVDDSSVVRDLIAVNLELEGLEVVRCADGLEALERVAEQRPDAITLDVMMPRLDGFSTAERLRADPTTADIPIVIVTGRASAADLARGSALGVDAYLTKPFEPSELVATVLRLVDQRH